MKESSAETGIILELDVGNYIDNENVSCYLPLPGGSSLIISDAGSIILNPPLL